MSSNQGLQDDGAVVRFHADNNNNTSSTTGTNDPYKDTPEFTVQELETHALVFAKRNSVGAIVPAAACTAATALILARNHSDDYRARAEVTQSGAVTTIDGADPLCLEVVDGLPVDTWGEWAAYKEHASDPDVVIVDQIDECDSNKVKIPAVNWAGIGTRDLKYAILLEEAFLDGGTLAHELGHNCDLGHTPTTESYIDYVMYETTAGTEELLGLEERDNFE